MAVHRKALPVVASWTFVAAWTLGWAWHMWPDSGVSWHFSVDGARLLLHGSGLNIYADAPWLQTGPLSLVVAALLSPLPANVGKGVALIAMTRCRPAAHRRADAVGGPRRKTPPDDPRGHSPHTRLDRALAPMWAPR
jgi:hypothetical protein